MTDTEKDLLAQVDAIIRSVLEPKPQPIDVGCV